MMTILHALKKWRPYLIGRHFKVKTDHDSLKYFLEQILSSEEQQKWVLHIKITQPDKCRILPLTCRKCRNSLTTCRKCRKLDIECRECCWIMLSQ
jgi:hypothetical protein